ncbi:hypothetical protein RKT74_23775 (plasmid) [Leclercia pneumoniae]|nr:MULTISPECIES: hypothetical protein [Enterobacteriaceae]MCV2514106.1 hypothetical protein [Leclercia pneumoniae]OUF18657.1 hypothetical protein AZ039_004595 [Enterobacter kobei]WNN83667.1 hypothetical protein RKT74_22880 [Leclercia pneumoniae]WNN83826.1 hypothetical protein RKT74_23775 [Leclercia pneumoniae]
MFLNWNEYRSGLLATIGKFAKLQPEFMKGFQQGSSQKTESMVTPVFATPILTTSWLA